MLYAILVFELVYETRLLLYLQKCVKFSFKSRISSQERRILLLWFIETSKKMVKLGSRYGLVSAGIRPAWFCRPWLIYFSKQCRKLYDSKPRTICEPMLCDEYWVELGWEPAREWWLEVNVPGKTFSVEVALGTGALRKESIDGTSTVWQEVVIIISRLMLLTNNIPFSESVRTRT